MSESQFGERPHHRPQEKETAQAGEPLSHQEAVYTQRTQALTDVLQAVTAEPTGLLRGHTTLLDELTFAKEYREDHVSKFHKKTAQRTERLEKYVGFDKDTLEAGRARLVDTLTYNGSSQDEIARSAGVQYFDEGLAALDTSVEQFPVEDVHLPFKSSDAANQVVIEQVLRHEDEKGQAALERAVKAITPHAGVTVPAEALYEIAAVVGEGREEAAERAEEQGKNEVIDLGLERENLRHAREAVIGVMNALREQEAERTPEQRERIKIPDFETTLTFLDSQMGLQGDATAEKLQERGFELVEPESVKVDMDEEVVRYDWGEVRQKVGEERAKIYKSEKEGTYLIDGQGTTLQVLLVSGDSPSNFEVRDADIGRLEVKKQNKMHIVDGNVADARVVSAEVIIDGNCNNYDGSGSNGIIEGDAGVINIRGGLDGKEAAIEIKGYCEQYTGGSGSQGTIGGNAGEVLVGYGDVVVMKNVRKIHSSLGGTAYIFGTAEEEQSSYDGKILTGEAAQKAYEDLKKRRS